MRHSMLGVLVVYSLEADPAWIPLYTRQLTSNGGFERKLNQDLFRKARVRGVIWEHRSQQPTIDGMEHSSPYELVIHICKYSVAPV